MAFRHPLATALKSVSFAKGKHTVVENFEVPAYYEIEASIAQGSYGFVALARDTRITAENEQKRKDRELRHEKIQQQNIQHQQQNSATGIGSESSPILIDTSSSSHTVAPHSNTNNINNTTSALAATNNNNLTVPNHARNFSSTLMTTTDSSIGHNNNMNSTIDQLQQQTLPHEKNQQMFQNNNSLHSHSSSDVSSIKQLSEILTATSPASQQPTSQQKQQQQQDTLELTQRPEDDVSSGNLRPNTNTNNNNNNPTVTFESSSTGVASPVVAPLNEELMITNEEDETQQQQQEEEEDKDDLVAIKKAVKLFSDPRLWLCATREICLMSYLRHKNIIEAKDVFIPLDLSRASAYGSVKQLLKARKENFSDCYIVMEYLPYTLRRLIDGEHLSPEEFAMYEETSRSSFQPTKAQEMFLEHIRCSQITRYDPQEMSRQHHELQGVSMVRGPFAPSLGLDSRAYLLYQLLRGVEYLHKMGIAHRDLKPENTLVNTRWDLKICDFGQGKGVSSKWASTPLMPGDRTIADVTTQWYAAPESLTLAPISIAAQYGNPSSAVTTDNDNTALYAADMWGVGCIAAELILGLPLFPSHSHGGSLQLPLIFHILGLPSDSDMTSLTQRRDVHTKRALKEILEAYQSRMRMSNDECVKAKLVQYMSQPYGFLRELLAQATAEEAEADPDSIAAEIDIVINLLQYDPSKRYTATQALESVLFADYVYEDEQELKLQQQQYGQVPNYSFSLKNYTTIQGEAQQPPAGVYDTSAMANNNNHNNNNIRSGMGTPKSSGTSSSHLRRQNQNVNNANSNSVLGASAGGLDHHNQHHHDEKNPNVEDLEKMEKARDDDTLEVSSQPQSQNGSAAAGSGSHHHHLHQVANQSNTRLDSNDDDLNNPIITQRNDSANIIAHEGTPTVPVTPGTREWVRDIEILHEFDEKDARHRLWSVFQHFHPEVAMLEGNYSNIAQQQ
jgi:serine/threonine protein kinase